MAFEKFCMGGQGCQAVRGYSLEGASNRPEELSHPIGMRRGEERRSPIYSLEDRAWTLSPPPPIYTSTALRCCCYSCVCCECLPSLQRSSYIPPEFWLSGPEPFNVSSDESCCCNSCDTRDCPVGRREWQNFGSHNRVTPVSPTSLAWREFWLERHPDKPVPLIYFTARKLTKLEIDEIFRMLKK